MAGVLVIFAAVVAVLSFGPGARPTPHSFHLQVIGTQMSPDQLQASYNDPLTISIVADRAEEVHLHGYDKHFFVKPGQPTTLSFPADKTGEFVLEIEATPIPGAGDTSKSTPSTRRPATSSRRSHPRSR